MSKRGIGRTCEASARRKRTIEEDGKFLVPSDLILFDRQRDPRRGICRRRGRAALICYHSLGTQVSDPRCFRWTWKFATTEQDQSGLGVFLRPSIVQTALTLRLLRSVRIQFSMSAFGASIQYRYRTGMLALGSICRAISEHPLLAQRRRP